LNKVKTKHLHIQVQSTFPWDFSNQGELPEALPKRTCRLWNYTFHIS